MGGLAGVVVAVRDRVTLGRSLRLRPTLWTRFEAVPNLIYWSEAMPDPRATGPNEVFTGSATPKSRSDVMSVAAEPDDVFREMPSGI